MKQGRAKGIKLLRIVIAIAAYGFVAFRLQKYSWNEILNTISELSVQSNWIVFSSVILLMPLSWFFEALKWKLALRDIEKTGICNAFRSVWYGVVTGILTPNRGGEPLGRMAMVSPSNRGKAALLAVWCGISQQLATLAFGLFGIILWSYELEKTLLLPFSHSFFIILICFAIVVFVALLFNMDWISKIIKRFGVVQRILSGESIEIKLSSLKTLSILLLSVVRYLIFSAQYVLLIFCFGIQAPTISIYAAITLTYLFSSLVPTFTLSEVGVRAGFALTFLGSISSNSSAIVMATLTIWMLNVGIPALTAAWFPWFRADIKR